MITVAGRIPRVPGWCGGKESACQHRRHKRHRFNPWVRKIPWSRKWLPIPVFLPGKSNGQRSLAGHSLWGRKELDTAEHTQAIKSKTQSVLKRVNSPRGGPAWAEFFVAVHRRETLQSDLPVVRPGLPTWLSGGKSTCQ